MSLAAVAGVPPRGHRVVLLGANPAELPVESFDKIELVVNLETAKALGLMIPQSILGRAEEVIE